MSEMLLWGWVIGGLGIVGWALFRYKKKRKELQPQ